MKRTHTCGELNEKFIGKQAILCGWVNSTRSHGGILFVDVRDRYGVTQVVFDPKHRNIDDALKLNKEDVVQVKGQIRKRPNINEKIPTGRIELLVDELFILSKSLPLPLDEHAIEDTRLKYRYLDLRSVKMQKNLLLRHKLTMGVRKYFDNNNFLEIETPMLAKSTPEGARDYLVPSRVHPCKFYALPQSPQLYKQLLMLGGLDRYFQIVKCFRDEDLRADRQPEFTQIDVEMSFVDEDDIFEMMEGMMKEVMKVINAKIKTPFKKMPYDEAMSKYGSDKPDLRFDMQLIDVTDIAKKSDFKIFREAKFIKCIKAEKAADFSRKELDEVTEIVKIYEARGLVWLKLLDNLEGQIEKFFSDEIKKELVKKTELKKGDFLFFIADNNEKTANVSLGQLRLHLGKKLNLIKPCWEFLWVLDFPMFEYDEKEKRYASVHHPFTSPKEMSLEYLKKELSVLKAKAYDLVLNGNELGGGSIRIHRSDIQARVFELLGISKKDAEQKFGFLLNAFKYGAPPHGGIAFGLDRVVALLAGEENIREVIAFPKTKSAEGLMEGSPGEVYKEQLDELHLKLKE